MIVDKTSGINIKIFIGFHANAEICMFLDRSLLWKQASVIPLKNRELSIQKIHFHSKDYFGCYLPDETSNLAELNQMKTLLKSLLKDYCPELSIDDIKTYVFSQVFIT